MGRTSELAPTLRRTNSSPIIIIENPAYIDKKKISSPSQGGDNLTKPRFKYNFIPDWARRGIKLNKPNFKPKKIPRIMSMPQRDYLSFNLVVNPFYNATETYVTSRPVNSHQTSGNESAETEKGKRKSNFENLMTLLDGGNSTKEDAEKITKESRLNNQDIGHRFHIHDDCPQVREGQVDERLPPLDIEDEPDEGSSVS